MFEKNVTLNRSVYTEKGRAYHMYGKQERCGQGFGGETYGKGTTWKTD
jgi:hypothetical protein